MNQIPSFGYKTIITTDIVINKIYNDKIISLTEANLELNESYPNLFLELKSESNSKLSVLGVINSQEEIIKLELPNPKHSLIKPRNREQQFAAWALYNDDIPIVSLAGIAGSGKTLLALAAAIDKTMNKKYEKIIITRPMSQVGKYKLGALPGTVDEKFSPYLLNYTTNLSKITGQEIDPLDLNHFYRIEMVPLQLIRGASFHNTFIIADELQVCDVKEVLTLGTRVGENSKIILMGDLDQIDEDIRYQDTGLYKFIDSNICKKSSLVANIYLQKCERSVVSELFSSALGAKNEIQFQNL